MYKDMDFVWLTPPVKTRLAVNIPDEESFNINRAFRDELPDRIAIGYNLEKMAVAIRADENGFALPKSGNLKLGEMIREFAARGMVFPARFAVTWDEDKWVGRLEEQKRPAVDMKKPPVRKKKPDIVSLSVEAARL